MPTITGGRKTAMEEPDDRKNNQNCDGYCVIQKMMTTEEVADLLRFGIEKVQGLARSGRLIGYKIEGEWRFFRKDVYAFILEHSNQHGRKEE